MSQQKYLSLLVRNSLTHSHLVIKKDSILMMWLHSYNYAPNLKTEYIPCLAIVFSMSDDEGESTVLFDATTNLYDGLRFYADVLRQLGIELSVPNLEDIVPPELRHLIEVQPEVTGRP